MEKVSELSGPRCVLLAVHYASESNVETLRALTHARPHDLPPELILQILLTYLPESASPNIYSQYIHEVTTGIYQEEESIAVTIDTLPVKDLSDKQAQKRVRKLDLLPVTHPSCQEDGSHGLLTLFLIHRAYRIDEETGMLDLVPQLVVPYLSHSEYLKTWFISVVLPLLRLGYEYYPESGFNPSLDSFHNLDASGALELLLSNAKAAKAEDVDSQDNLSRDIKSLVGPWMYGCNQRKRRRLDSKHRRPSKAGLNGLSSFDHPEASDTHDWEKLYLWLVETASQSFPRISKVIQDWDGPGDVDFGDFDNPNSYLEDDVQGELERRYAQSIFASIYAVDSDGADVIESAHSLLIRLSRLLDYETPPPLVADFEQLPNIQGGESLLQDTSKNSLQLDTLLEAGNTLTSPKPEAFSVLRVLIFTAYLLSGLGYSISVAGVAKLRIHSNEDEQYSLLQNILHSLANGSKKDAAQWILVRNKLIWLWNWGLPAESTNIRYGTGVLGRIERPTLEMEILKALLSSAHFSVAIKTYVEDPHAKQYLSAAELEQVILSAAYQHYDNASNGNRNRGGMKKASDIIAAFDPYFAESPAFSRFKSLLAATHALSFYSLTLQRGVPFVPANIRVTNDPISLLEKVLQQNAKSYTKLDDLITIGQNLVAAGLGNDLNDVRLRELSENDLNDLRNRAERRVLGMAVDGALQEDDFETAYSYVVNRLEPLPSPEEVSAIQTTHPAAGIKATERRKAEDDISWRAALLAGKHSSTPLSGSQPSLTSNVSPILRRLEQRMELLSRALVLAPPPAVCEILEVWKQCENEMLTLLDHETEEERRFDDRADKKLPGAFVNATAPVQPRREIGRGATEEAPMGLFEVARGAATAFTRSFPLGATGSRKASGEMHMRTPSIASSEDESLSGMYHDGEGRVRKRDMVASAVTGGLASGIGWVLGATPNTPGSRQ